MSEMFPPPDSDDALVRHFERLFGHSPTAVELPRYRAQSRVTLRLPSRLRRRAAHLIVRL
ncbi:hypothetical protein [Nocardioides sp. Soil777]|uniref:hypothetical protein n=1 Tax=Nocardioides sp. Soil777 TaxID=1736409 RepID=UPI0012F7B069|nr:hypothetical protein [Nocardioides sp. Soil777]